MNLVLPGLGDAYALRAERYLSELAAIRAANIDGRTLMVQLEPDAPPAEPPRAESPGSSFSAPPLAQSAVLHALTGRRKRFYSGLDLLQQWG